MGSEANSTAGGSAGEALDLKRPHDNQSSAAPAFPYRFTKNSLGEQKSEYQRLSFRFAEREGIRRIISPCECSSTESAPQSTQPVSFCSGRTPHCGCADTMPRSVFRFRRGYPFQALSASPSVRRLRCPASFTFVVSGRGTSAPFDAPRQLVAVGPYRWVRNPMYLGAGLVVVGYACYEKSIAVLLLAAAM
jgi:hypothetical protein